MAAGIKEDLWLLKTPPGASCYSTYKDPQASPPALVCQAGSTTLKYHLRAIKDLHAWPCGQDGGVSLAAADVRHIPSANAGGIGLVELTHGTRNNQIRSIR